LLVCLNVLDDVSELGALVHEAIFECEELHILDDEAHFIIVVVRVTLVV